MQNICHAGVVPIFSLIFLSFPRRRESSLRNLDYPVKLDNDNPEVRHGKVIHLSVAFKSLTSYAKQKSAPSGADSYFAQRTGISHRLSVSATLRIVPLTNPSVRELRHGKTPQAALGFIVKILKRILNKTHRCHTVFPDPFSGSNPSLPMQNKNPPLQGRILILRSGRDLNPRSLP